MNKFNFKGTWDFIKRHKKLLIYVFVISIVVSAGISLLLPNYYKSQALLLPTASNALSKSYLNESDRFDPYMYGTEKESEYIMEILGSSQILENVALKYKLKEHYNIRHGVAEEERMLLKLKKNIQIKRSDYLGVRLTVWDRDPQYASDIANYMIEQLHILRIQMKQAKADSILNSLQVAKQRMLDSIDCLADSLSVLSSQSHIYFPEHYADRMSQELAKQIASGNQGGVVRLEQKMDSLAKYGPQVDNLTEQLQLMRKNLQEWQAHYERAVLDANASIPNDFVVQKATPSQKKDKPKRSIIVIISALCCTLIAAEVIALREKSSSKNNESSEEV